MEAASAPSTSVCRPSFHLVGVGRPLLCLHHCPLSLEPLLLTVASSPPTRCRPRQRLVARPQPAPLPRLGHRPARGVPGLHHRGPQPARPRQRRRHRQPEGRRPPPTRQLPQLRQGRALRGPLRRPARPRHLPRRRPPLEPPAQARLPLLRSLRRFSGRVLREHLHCRLLPHLDAAAGSSAALDLQDVLRRFSFDTSAAWHSASRAPLCSSSRQGIAAVGGMMRSSRHSTTPSRSPLHGGWSAAVGGDLASDGGGLLAGDPHGGRWCMATGGIRLFFSKVCRNRIAFLKSLQGLDGIFEKCTDTAMWDPHVS